jgi:hypothetical protein
MSLEIQEWETWRPTLLTWNQPALTYAKARRLVGSGLADCLGVEDEASQRPVTTETLWSTRISCALIVFYGPAAVSTLADRIVKPTRIQTSFLRIADPALTATVSELLGHDVAVPIPATSSCPSRRRHRIGPRGSCDMARRRARLGRCRPYGTTSERLSRQ